MAVAFVRFIYRFWQIGKAILITPFRWFVDKNDIPCSAIKAQIVTSPATMAKNEISPLAFTNRLVTTLQFVFC